MKTVHFIGAAVSALLISSISVPSYAVDTLANVKGVKTPVSRGTCKIGSQAPVNVSATECQMRCDRAREQNPNVVCSYSGTLSMTPALLDTGGNNVNTDLIVLPH